MISQSVKVSYYMPKNLIIGPYLLGRTAINWMMKCEQLKKMYMFYAQKGGVRPGVADYNNHKVSNTDVGSTEQ